MINGGKGKTITEKFCGLTAEVAKAAKEKINNPYKYKDRMEKIKIGNKKYNVSLAKTQEEQEKGLQDVKNLPENEGMLFIFDEPDKISFWMKDTEIPLDIVFINEEMDVISVKEGIPNSEDFIEEDNVLYVLEVNKNSGIKQGDELEFDNVNINTMHVLDSNGNSQMEIEGGERIFSRPDTKKLIKFSKKAYITKNDKDYKALGTRLFKFIRIQDSNDPDYVTVKQGK